jgi:hypothetical protein
LAATTVKFESGVCRFGRVLDKAACRGHWEVAAIQQELHKRLVEPVGPHRLDVEPGEGVGALVESAARTHEGPAERFDVVPALPPAAAALQDRAKLEGLALPQVIDERRRYVSAEQLGEVVQGQHASPVACQPSPRRARFSLTAQIGPEHGFQVRTVERLTRGRRPPKMSAAR